MIPIRPFEAGIRSSGIVSPTIRSASSAPRRKVSVRPVDLDERVADRLAGLEGDQPAELLAAGLDPGADVAQDRAALVGGQRPGDLERLDGGLDRLLVLGVASRGTSSRRGGRDRPGWRSTSGSSDSTQRPGEEDRMRLGAGRGGHRGLLRTGSVVPFYPRPRSRPASEDQPMSPVPSPLPRDLLRVKPGSKVRLADIDPGDTHGRDKERPSRELQKGLDRLTSLQDRLWAEQKHPVLIVLQGIDAAGKDGSVRHVMSAFNPMGCTVTSFKVPTPIELAHDYLWRVHQRAPARARSRSSTGPTTRTSSSSGSTTSSRRRSGRGATPRSTRSRSC